MTKKEHFAVPRILNVYLMFFIININILHLSTVWGGVINT